MTVTAVLWDIDGTLLTSGGVAAGAFLDAVADVTGTRPPPGGRDFGGRIDPEIAAMLLASIGLDDQQVPAVLGRLEELVAQRTDALSEHTRPLGGVVDVVGALSAAGVRQTVVTGNVRTVARLKLQAAALIPPIEVEVGGYGDSGRDRAEVARSALMHLAASGWAVALDECWIVGDTPRDWQCAQALGLRCALIATGHHSFDSLATLGADVVLTGLDDAAELYKLWELD